MNTKDTALKAIELAKHIRTEADKCEAEGFHVSAILKRDYADSLEHAARKSLDK